MGKAAKCVTGKKMYPSLIMAEDALIDAVIRFEHRSGNGPIAVYRCDDCGLYHLTSKGTMNDRLAAMIKNGSIAKEKEANKWLDKFKKTY